MLKDRAKGSGWRIMLKCSRIMLMIVLKDHAQVLKDRAQGSFWRIVLKDHAQVLKDCTIGSCSRIMLIGFGANWS